MTITQSHDNHVRSHDTHMTVSPAAASGSGAGFECSEREGEEGEESVEEEGDQ